jgi:hypothetical protein
MRRLLLVLGFCAGVPLAGAQETTTPRDRLGAACRELETGDPKRAFAAVQAISQLGGASLPAIEERLKEAKGRVRDYLELAAEEIRNAPYLPSYPPVKRVTMKSTDRNVVELLSDLRAKTGIPLSLDNLMDEEKLPEIPFEVKDATVLEAFDAICHSGNVTVAMENGGFTLFTGAYVDQPRFFYGHYYFRLGEFDVTKVVTFRKPAIQRFNIQMEMIWDPAAAPARFKPVRILEAMDDRGKSLLLPPAPAVAPADGEESGSDMTLRLLPPSPAATKLTVLRGVLTIALPKTRSTLVLAAPADGKATTSGDLTCKILAHDAEQRHFVLQLSSRKLKPEALEALDYTVHVGLKGWESTRANLSKTSHTEQALEILVNYEPLRMKDGPIKPPEENPAPLTVERVELSVVTSTQDKRIPFDFRDLKIR